VAEADRAAREERERHPAAKAAEAQRLAEAEAARQAEEKRRAKETAEVEGVAREKRIYGEADEKRVEVERAEGTSAQPKDAVRASGTSVEIGSIEASSRGGRPPEHTYGSSLLLTRQVLL
jgi:hypothetical protein